MVRRTRPPRPRAAAHDERSAPLKESCQQCGQLLWVGYHAHRTVTKLDGRWRVDDCGASLYPAEVPALPCGLPSRSRGRLGTATRRIWPCRVIALIGHWRFREHRSVPERHRARLSRGVSITERSVTNLMQRYPRIGGVARGRSRTHQGALAEAGARDLSHRWVAAGRGT